MATRPTWLDMRNEVQVRLGNHQYTTGPTASIPFTTRVERWLTSAFYHCVTTWHQPELDAEDESQTFSVGATSVAFPSDIKVPMAVAILEPGTTNVDRWLLPRDFHTLQHMFDETQAKPKYCSRFGNDLYINTKSNAAYPVRVFYYRVPDLPVFTDPATSPLSAEWDEIIMGKAVCFGYESLWRPDLSSIRQQALSLLLQSVPNGLLREDMLADRTTAGKTDESHMGVLG